MKTQGRTRSTGPKIVVRSLSGRSTRGVLTYGTLSFPCVLGRSGRIALKREGDGATPIGEFALREAFYRADRGGRPQLPLHVSAIRPDDGWCDAVGDRNYNRPVRHPYPESAEHMWRKDRLYDLVIVLACNDSPRIAGRGSAIFMHVASPGMTPTEGCVALQPQHLRRLMSALRRGTKIKIVG